MNKFMKGMVIPTMIFVGIAYGAYLLVEWNISRIKRDPDNMEYISMQERDRQVNCLAENVYYESAGEDAEGKVLVAQITINRANSGKFPSDICAVIHQKSQFSWTMDKPKALRVKNVVAYNESKEVAKRVLMEGYRLPSLKKSLYYHTKDVSPSWDKSMVIDAKIGNHIAYSLRG